MARSFVFCLSFVDRCLSFFFKLLYFCLSFHLRLLITTWYLQTFPLLRDRPFNLKGGGGGGGCYGFLFRSEIFLRTTRELEYFFFCRAKREIFFHKPTLGYMTKTLNQIIFFPSTKIRIFFSATLGIRIFF